MLDNDKLNKRIKKIFKELKEKWRITPYRIAVETGIPHSSLKYMVDEKFEWKLNHLLSIVDFLNRYGAKISLADLLDFSNKKSLSQIMNDDKADFRRVKIRDKSALKKGKIKKSDEQFRMNSGRKDLKSEADSLANEISETVKENRLFKTSKITVSVKINGKSIDYRKLLNFNGGKTAK